MTLRNVQNELLAFSHFLQTGLLTVVLNVHFFFFCFFPFYKGNLNILFLMPWHHHSFKAKF